MSKKESQQPFYKEAANRFTTFYANVRAFFSGDPVFLRPVTKPVSTENEPHEVTHPDKIIDKYDLLEREIESIKRIIIPIMNENNTHVSPIILEDIVHIMLRLSSAYDTYGYDMPESLTAFYKVVNTQYGLCINGGYDPEVGARELRDSYYKVFIFKT